MENSITQDQINTLPPECAQCAEETINWLFQELKSIFLGWRAAFETETDYLSAKKTWLRVLAREKITRPQLENGLCEAEKSLDKFLPSVGLFVYWCKAYDYHALGLPNEAELYQRYKTFLGYARFNRDEFQYRSKVEFHLSVYHTRPEANAVVHNHSIHCAGLSILEKPIPAIHYMVAVSGTDHIPCVPYATFGSHELASYVATGIKESKAILLAHHGLITCGENLDKALWLAQEVEVLASWYLKLLSTGLEIPLLSKEQMQVVLGKFHTYGLRIEES
ncbi:L-fuculose phosphate aldolase [Haemophilus influenzae HK1212]|uniref:L-fuculose phosphate aldolase n=1 Tax=Haemophilus influenzae HK1212 TaxID=456482 RepID=A0A7G2K064_HAEIF|nr:L-fuculose phosphate aldolase [Haemophilus influenzae HK1212]